MKKLHIILFTLGALFCLSSCELEDRRYTGPLFVEFSPDQYGQTASPSGIVKTAPIVGQDQLGVQLIGLAQPEQLNVNFRIADQVFYIIGIDRYVAELPEGYTPNQYQILHATGKYGVDYTLDGLSGVTYNKTYGRGSFSISANNQFGTIPVNVLRKADTQIFFVLEDSDNLRANKPTALLRYQMSRAKTMVYSESFSTDPFGRGWKEIDKDGDGYTWEWYGNPPSITSDSYAGGNDIDPENYLVSPAISIPAGVLEATLEFEVASGASSTSSYYKEHYTVLVSTVPITADNCRNIPVLKDDTELTQDNRGKRFTTVTLDLTPYRGKTVYFSIAHKNSFGQNYILVRNFSVFHY